MKVHKGVHKGVHNSSILKKLSKQQQEVLILLRYKTPKQIAEIRGVSSRAVYKIMKKLEFKGIIQRIGYGVYEEIVNPPPIGMRVEKPPTQLHALQIKFPILEGKIRDKDWQIINKLNHWLPKYKDFRVLGGLKVRNNNNKSITVFAKSRYINSLEEVDQLAFKIRTYIFDFFKKQAVILDVFNAEVKNLDMATKDKKAESMIRKGEKFVLNLDKKAEKIFPKDNINAKAMIDGSPFKFSAETNDLEWKREYLSMPFRILDLFGLIDLLTRNVGQISDNYMSHVGIVIQAKDVLGKLNKTLDEIQKKNKKFK